MAAHRQLWRAAQAFIAPESLVFLHDTGKSAKMARLYGWGSAGERRRDRVPFGHWKIMTFIVGLRLTGVTAHWELDGPMDSAFRVYVLDNLALTLRPGDIVVLDNPPAHKVAGIREAITARRAQLCYVPQYSPDMNPIEMASPSSGRWYGRSRPAPSMPLSSVSATRLIVFYPTNEQTTSTPPSINGQGENAFGGNAGPLPRSKTGNLSLRLLSATPEIIRNKEHDPHRQVKKTKTIG